jgi:hypothetical protein
MIKVPHLAIIQGEFDADIRRRCAPRNHRRLRKVGPLILVFLLFLCRGAAGGLFENNSSFSALEAAWKAWKNSVEFKGDFVFRDGTAPTKELALEGRFGSAVDKPKAENYAIGSFAKLGNRIRYSQLNKQHPDKAQLYFDEISTDSLYLVSQKTGDRLRALVTPRPDSLAGKVVSGVRMSLTFHPFSAGLKLDGSLRDFLAARPGFDEKVVSASIVKPDASHIVVQVVKTFRKDSDTITIRCRFWTDVSPPIIERIEIVQDFPSRNKRQEGIVSFGDFVKCTGGFMPRCVRKAFGPIVPVGEAEPVWLCKEWKSNDLGKVPPTEKDFVYVAPLDSSIVGLNAKVPIVDGKYHLDLAAYTSKDFEFMPNGSILAKEQAIAPKQSTNASPTRYITLVSCGVLLLVLVFIMVWRHRR